METTHQEFCRVCKGDLVDVLNLGNIYPSNFVLKDDIEKYERAPLILAQCQNCGLVQLHHTVDLDSMYRQYYYRSSLNKSMIKSLGEVVDEINRFVTLKKGDTVIDIGCNDGTMFNFYPDFVTKIGFDPALNLKEYAEKNCNYFINDYFPGKNTQDWTNYFKVITAIAMFYDLPDPVEFTKAVSLYLKDDGIFVIQFTDLKSMLELNAFDNICHEHLEYYRLTDVEHIIDSCGLRVFHASVNDVNGGSIRIFCCHKNAKFETTQQLNTIREEEYKYFLHDDIRKFSKRIHVIKNQLMQFLRDTSSLSVSGLGASTKGNTLLQYFGITPFYVKEIGEVNSDKFGKYTLGTSIPILPEKDVLDKMPNMCLVLPWHFCKTFLEKYKDYLSNGGTLLFPLPTPVLYFYKDDELRLLDISEL